MIKLYKMRSSLHLKVLMSVMLMFIAITGVAQQKIDKPTILYTNNPPKYTIGGINLSGVDNIEPAVILGISGLSVGDVISVPGDAVTDAIKRFWKHGLFEDVVITADSIVGDKIYIGISLNQRPTSSHREYSAVTHADAG